MLSELELADRANTELSKHFKSSEAIVINARKCTSMHKKFVISMSSQGCTMIIFVMNAELHKTGGGLESWGMSAR